jgi:thiol:disulfide interchange protein DsbC
MRSHNLSNRPRSRKVILNLCLTLIVTALVFASALNARAADSGIASQAKPGAFPKNQSAAPPSGNYETQIRQSLQKNYPQIAVDSVAPTPLPGIYEVLANGQLIYTDAKAAYLFVNGSLIDTAKQINLTQERFNQLTAIRFDQLPLNLAFKKVKGAGTRKLAVFSDPDCPFCKRIEPELAKLDNVTIYMFLYPIAALHPEAVERSKRVWCSPNKAKAWDDLMLRNVVPAADPTCGNPIDKLAEFGDKHRINGTPTLIFADGQRVAGAMTAEQMEQRLAAAKSR